MRLKTLSSLLCLAAATAALPACNKETPTGTLIVPFDIGLGAPCEALSVREVTVELWSMPEDGGVSENVESASDACATGKIVFNTVPAGNYEIKAYGTNENDTVVVDNEGRDPVDIGEVLSGAENTADVVNLSPTPAKVYVRWQIEKNDFQAMCSEVAVANFEVSIAENGGTKQLYSYDAACDAPKDAELKSYVRVEDEGREIDGAELDRIRIAPQDATGNSAGEPVFFDFATPPGPGETIRLTVTANCDDTACDLSCAADPCTPDA